MYKNKR